VSSAILIPADLAATHVSVFICGFKEMFPFELLEIEISAITGRGSQITPGDFLVLSYGA
jgi:hypothetical protein